MRIRNLQCICPYFSIFLNAFTFLLWRRSLLLFCLLCCFFVCIHFSFLWQHVFKETHTFHNISSNWATDSFFVKNDFVTVSFEYVVAVSAISIFSIVKLLLNIRDGIVSLTAKAKFFLSILQSRIKNYETLTDFSIGSIVHGSICHKKSVTWHLTQKPLYTRWLTSWQTTSVLGS